MKKYPSILLFLLSSAFLYAQNPYLPLWEHIPDGEPYVFEDPDRPGSQRVYVYGSHDVLGNAYCGLDQVLWSAPTDDLSAWRYEGVIFTSLCDADGRFLNRNGQGDLLYAPDVAETIGPDGKKMYYFYPNNQAYGRNSMVACSNRPDGPFTVCNWDTLRPGRTKGALGFDPAVFVDDDGRVYGYWGFKQSYMAELDPSTMATVKPGTEVLQGIDFNFFEASSMRKIEDKYVFVFSRWTEEGEFGLPASNYTLAYAYSDAPLGPFTYGGTIIDARGRATDAEGKTICTATVSGNTHGSIVRIGEDWWVFYHRQTGLDEYSRQAMVAKIEVAVEKGPGGKVSISEGEYNSEGFSTDGLSPFQDIPAALACYYTGPQPAQNGDFKFRFPGSYVESGHSVSEPSVVNNTAGSVVGFKYLNFNRLTSGKKTALVMRLRPLGVAGTVRIMAGSPYEGQGVCLGSLILDGRSSENVLDYRTVLSIPRRCSGKQALYFLFESPQPGSSLGDFISFRLEPL